MREMHFVFTENRLNVQCMDCGEWTNRPHCGEDERLLCEKCCPCKLARKDAAA